MKKVHILLASLIGAVLLIGVLIWSVFGRSTMSVVATSPVYDVTKNIVGNEATVHLIKQDDETSTKENLIQKASSIVVHDADELKGLEVKNMIEGSRDMTFLPQAEEEEHHHHHGDDEHTHELDKRTWLSPKRMMQEVENIKSQLISAHPNQAQAFEQNAATYLAKIKQLDEAYQTAFANAEQKSFVTQDDAFSYLALDYGLNQIKLNDIYPGVKPSATRLAELKDYVAANDIKYLYFTEQTDTSFNETLAKEANVQVAYLNTLQNARDTDDYIQVMTDNLKSLEKTTANSGKTIEPETVVETAKTVSKGYFEDSRVKPRELSDFYGDWQSVYPYLKDGTLDPVFDYKSKLNKDMTADEYKNYYDAGYKTDVDQIIINKDNSMTFVTGNTRQTFNYVSDGYKVLTYKKGNRGVRFNFKTDDPNAGRFKYIQFSDHNIAPVQTSHYHIYFGGESQEKLYNELTNWPTYYPKQLSGLEVAQEMLAH